MNAAFLLVTTAWFAGADPAPTTATAPTGTPAGAVASAPFVGGAMGGAMGGAAGGCCGGSAMGGYGGCGCEIQCCCKPSCLQRLKGCFHRNKCCCESCCGCGGGYGGGYGGGCGMGCGTGGGGCGNTCATTSCCNSGCGGIGGGYGGGYAGGCGCCEPCCCKPSCMQRLKACFHRNKCCCETCCGYGGGYGGGCGTGCGTGCGGIGGAGIGGAGIIGGTPGIMPGAEPIKILPKDANPGKPLPGGNKGAGSVQSDSIGVQPTSSSNISEQETKNPFELDRRYETRVGRATDYSWVTGQLCYVHADGGLWVLRYAPLWKEDANGGSIILARDRQMDSYREGDLVKVHGEILNQKGSIFLGGPLYRAESIELIDRSAH